jgi:hypothetical protein
MDTRQHDASDAGPDAFEARLRRIPLDAPPADLRAACLSGAGRRRAGAPGLQFWQRLWSGHFPPHPVVSMSLAAAWMTIFGLWLATPEVGQPETARYARVPEETRRALATQRAELMASLRGIDAETAREPGEPQPRRIHSPATQAPRSSLLQTNRMA